MNLITFFLIAGIVLLPSLDYETKFRCHMLLKSPIAKLLAFTISYLVMKRNRVQGLLVLILIFTVLSIKNNEIEEGFLNYYK